MILEPVAFAYHQFRPFVLSFYHFIILSFLLLLGVQIHLNIKKMKNSKTLLSRTVGMLAFIFSMMLFTPSFASASDCELWTGNWLICEEDYDDTVAAIKAACGGSVPAAANIMTQDCNPIIE